MLGIPAKVVVRDLLVLAITLLMWAWVRQLQHTPGALYVTVAFLTGGLTAFSGFLGHEWGHLIGARMAGGVYAPPESVFSIFLFRFNSDLNTREQFVSMSMGGFVSSVLIVALLFWQLSFDHLADQVALGLTVLGVIATFILEVPDAWKVHKGAPIPRGAAYSSKPA
jgi:hypothetical protein